MAKNRYINTKFWEDGYIVNILPHDKLLFLYFLTSPLSNISGVYECPLKIMSAHTGFDEDELQEIIPHFEGKIHYIDGWVYIRNFVKHQSSESASVKRGIEIEMEKIPKSIIEKIKEIESMYDQQGNARLFDVTKIDTKKDKEKKEKAKKNTEKLEKSIDNIVKFYNERINSRSSLTDRARRKLILRLTEFKEEAILDGIFRFSEDDWRMSHNKSQGMEWFFNSQGQVQKWVELNPQKKEVKKIVNI